MKNGVKSAQSQYIHVKATAGAKKETIEQAGTNKWKVSVREKAKEGGANARIKEVLATRVGVLERDLRLIKGATSPSKLYLLRNNHTEL